MQKIIKMSEYPEIMNLLERTYYEVETRENIIKLIINDNLLEYYEKYWEEYLLYLKIYDTIQKNFYKQYYPEYNYKNCILNFNTQEIIINY